MRTAGHIFADRKKSESALRTLKNKEILLNNPRSVLLFPEGTRTRDGSLGPFKRGGLLLSLDTAMPIVPIAFIGSFEMFGKGSWSMKGRFVELREVIQLIQVIILMKEEESANHVREKVADLM